MYDKKLEHIYAVSDGIDIADYEALARLAQKDKSARVRIRALIGEWEAADRRHDRSAMRKAVNELVDLVPEEEDGDEGDTVRRYTVNVHYDAVATVVVEASSEEEALELAEAEADGVDAQDMDFGLTESCVTDVEDL